MDNPDVRRALILVRAAHELLKLAQAEYLKDDDHLLISDVYEHEMRAAIWRLEAVEWFAEKAGHDKPAALAADAGERA